ncbi:hypothetical protein KIH41_02205 [Litoribacter ruber]|uniref:hypothetical protein n=1 Tax=Litoribacter ruber TaxID=702568 RepID=UPI001BDB2BEB|nr:hypothetical protein [Litoribacter ruber]MBT0810092.1 hypothetical protein [Litoribacter ruber]
MKILFFSLLIFVFYSCQTNSFTFENDELFDSSNIVHKELTLNLKEKLIIESDDSFPNYNYLDYVKFGDSNCLLGFDNISLIIDFIDLNKKEIVNRMFLGSKKEFSFNSPQEIFYHSEDSIYLFAPGGNLTRINSQSDILEHIKINKEIKQTNEIAGVDPLSNSQSFFVLNSKLYIRSFPKLDWSKDYKYYQKPSLIKLNSDFTYEPIIGFPNYMSLSKGIYFVNDYRYSFTKNLDNSKILISYRRDPCIYIYDLKDKTIENKFSKSVFLNEFKLIERGYNPQAETNVLIENGIYHNIYKDYENNFYYRIVSHSQQLKNDSGYLNNAGVKNFSIIVHDDQFNYLGEAKVPDGRNYTYLMMSPTDKGIVFLNRKSSQSQLELDFYEIIF